MENPREHPFWKDNNTYCNRCTRSQHYCTCSGGPRGAKFYTGKYDQPHGNDQ